MEKVWQVTRVFTACQVTVHTKKLVTKVTKVFYYMLQMVLIKVFPVRPSGVSTDQVASDPSGKWPKCSLQVVSDLVPLIHVASFGQSGQRGSLYTCTYYLFHSLH